MSSTQLKPSIGTMAPAKKKTGFKSTKDLLRKEGISAPGLPSVSPREDSKDQVKKPQRL